MYDEFLRKLENVVVGEKTTLLAVSGGVDSIVMVDLFQRRGIPFVIAHAHFGLRGTASDADANFVAQLAKQCGVKCYTKQFSTAAYAQQHKISIQMAARELRYSWFRELVQQEGLGQIATAHHLGDHVETVLWHLVRGSGIVGFGGIPLQQDGMIRPLLWAKKEEIVSYAGERRLQWREDSSNATIHYARNYIRHEIVPRLEKLNPNLAHTVGRTAARLSQVGDFWLAYSEEIKSKVWRQEGDDIAIQVEELFGKSYATALLYEWLGPYGFHWDMVLKWVNDRPQKGRTLVSEKYILQVEGKNWVLAKRALDSLLPHYTITKDRQRLTFPMGKLVMKLCEPNQVSFPQPNHVALLDYAQLQFPLTLRPWQAGDIFSPLGMGHRQKVSDLLTNAKVPSRQKKKVYVLLSGDQIVWVVGYRLAEGCKVSKGTQTIYRIALMP